METINIDHETIEDVMRQTMDEFDGDSKAVVDLQRVLSAKHAGVKFKKPIIIDSLEEQTMPEENKTFKVSAEPDKTAVIDDKFAVKTEFNDKQFTFSEQDAREAFMSAFKTMLEADDIKGDIFVEIEKVKNRKNLGLFSATISQEVMTVSWMYQRDEVEITVEPKQEDRPDIDQFSITVTPLEKAETTLRLIRTQGYERVIIFCNTKHMCQRLCDDFRRAGLDCDCIHGDVRQSQREKTMQRYRDGKLQVLIATDVASRGIDVDDVDCVVNFDVPEENEYYVHRIGRTGRAKRKGVAWSIIGNFPEKAKLDEIAKYSNYSITPMVLSPEGTLSVEQVKAPAPVKKRFR